MEAEEKDSFLCGIVGSSVGKGRASEREQTNCAQRNQEIEEGGTWNSEDEARLDFYSVPADTLWREITIKHQNVPSISFGKQLSWA